MPLEILGETGVELAISKSTSVKYESVRERCEI
jgi:hypothetical protein